MRGKVLLLCSLLLFCFSAISSAQVSKVSGIVISAEDNEPVVGASIMVKGTTLGTISDLNGKFSLTGIPSSAKSLEVSYLGMKTQVVQIKSNVKVVLEPDSKVIDEVVVTGMQRMDKRMFTGATSQLKAEDMKLDGMADISRSLEGRSAGVSVQNVSGTFGTAPKIRVRGATSIYGNSRPLWVVDGVVMEDAVEVSADALSSGDAETLVSSAISGLNSDDIESMQILKDGSATSIYGARAMAGVIVITTKKGKAGQSHVNYTGEFTMRLKPSYRNFNIMNSQEQMAIYKEMEEKGWLNFNAVYHAEGSGVYGRMYKLINTYDPTTGTFGLENTPEARAAYLREAEYRNTDWFDELFTNSIMQNHSISISTGTDRSSLYASLSVMTDPGWYKQSKVNRYTANINSSYNITKNLTLNLLGNASYRKQNAPGTLGQNIDAVSGEVKRDFDINPYSYALNTSRAMSPTETYTRNYADFNILKELEENYIELNVADMKWQGELKWKPVGELELGVVGAVKYSTSSQEHYITDESNQALAYRAMWDSQVRDANNYLYKNPDDPYALPISILPVGGFYMRDDYKTLGTDFRATANWNHVWSEKHFTNLFGGMETSAIDRSKSHFNGVGMQYSMGETPYYMYELFKQGIERGTDPYYSLKRTRMRSAAFFANLTYNYAGKYTLNGTVRYEGTNKLGKSRSARWLPTWNVSGAWNAHEEKFFEALKPAFSHATIKASYSLTADRGPQDVTNSMVVVKSKTPFRPFTNIQENCLYIDDLENSELTYEKKHEFNIGGEFGFIDNRLNIAVDWYKRNNFDLIGIINTMGVGGLTQKKANVASMKSHGVEFTISSKNIKTKNFSWNTDLIYSLAKNEVTSLKSNSRIIDLITGSGFAVEGYPVRGLFSIPFAGLTEDGLPSFYPDVDRTETTIDGIYFQEREETEFLKYEGPTDPTFTGSIGNTFTYKNLRLNVYITYSGGNVIRLDPVFKARYRDLDLTSMTKDFMDRWTLPGDENITNVPVLLSARQYNANNDYQYAYNSYNYCDQRIAKGDFVRMKEVSLSYDFPKSWLESIKINNLSLKLQATNLFLIYSDSKLKGQDPEFFNSGGVAAPVPKQFTFTVRVGL